MARKNPLLTPSTLPNQAPTFDAVRDSDYLPAIRKALKEARANVRAIKNNPDKPTFENTIVALETSDELLGDVYTLLSNQISAAKTEGLKAAKDKISPLVAKFSSSVGMDGTLFKKIKAVWEEHQGHSDLTAEQQTLLNRSYSSFRRSGIALKGDARKRMKDIKIQSANLGTEFNENVMGAVQKFSLIIEQADDLKGLPESAINGAAAEANRRGQDGKWIFTLDIPSYLPFMYYAENRDLREKMWRAYSTRAWKDDYDNQATLKKIVEFRHESAQLLGYQNHAGYVLEDRMAENAETVFAFLNKLKDVYKPAALEELRQLKEFVARNNGPAELMPWDISYYSEKQKEAEYGFSDEELRPYFPKDRVMKGLFEHFGEQFGVKFIENRAYQTWATDVQAYDVTDQETGAFVGTLFTDLHPRDGKKPGAWMTQYRSQGLYKGAIERPVTAIVCNLTKPLPDKEACFTHGEVLTLLHEMGHDLHGLLSNVTYRSLASPNTEWDAVELPSQSQEKWGFTRKTLDRLTGDDNKIPDELLEKMVKAKNFMAGYMGLRQVMMSLVDMTWYTTDPKEIESKYGFDVFKFEEDITKDLRLFPMLGGPLSTTFSHIFAGGYSSGYYSYQWADVLASDAYEHLTEREDYDHERLTNFRRAFLEKGRSAPAAVLYRNFRGRNPDPDSLLRNEGLLPKVA